MPLHTEYRISISDDVGTLTIETSMGPMQNMQRQMQRGVRITVRDTGYGIPKDIIPKLFTPFFSTKSKGTGLGLAVVQRIVNRHKGNIDVHSKKGEGTAFFITLPLDA